MPLEGQFVNNDDVDVSDCYILWSPSSSVAPRYVYRDRPTAIKVAHMMAAKNPGAKFCVAKLVGEARQVKVHYKDYEG